jgi:WD40 repeat protein
MRYEPAIVLLVTLLVAGNARSQDWTDEFLVGKDSTPVDDSLEKPKLGETYTDPVTGLDITRVATAKGTRFNRINYSRIQAENADGSYFFTYHGNSEYRVYDAKTLKLVRRLPLDPNAELQWHPTNPELIRFTAGSNAYVGKLQLFEINVTGGGKKVIADLKDKLPWKSVRPRLGGSGYLADGGEGSPSIDGTRYAWAVFDIEESMVGLVSYDLATDTVLGTREVTSEEKHDIDHISMSPSGKYIIVSGDGVTVYNADFSNPRKLVPTTEHSDIAVGADGDDYYLHIDFESSNGDIVAINLRTGDKIVLFSMYRERATTSMHVSGKAFGRPGWAVFSTYYPKHEGQAWTFDKVFAMSFDPSLRKQIVLNLAHTRNCAESYWTEPHAVPNRDLTHVYFNSNWDSCNEDAEVYRIAVPPIGGAEAGK